MPGNAIADVGSLTLVLSGTAGTLLSKLLYQLEGAGRDGRIHAFEKPWASTALMFLGMAACLPAAAAARTVVGWLRRLQGPAEASSLTEPLLMLQRRSQRPLLGRPSLTGTPTGTPPGSMAGSTATSMAGPMVALWGVPAAAANGAGGMASAPNDSSSLRQGLALILIPTAFDLVATILMSVGLLYVTASVFSMVRGSEVVFSALLATACLRRHLNRWHVGGIALCTAGVSVVGVAGFLEGADPSAPSTAAGPGAASLQDSPRAPTVVQLLMGMGLVLAAEAVQAGQVVVEDLFLHSLDLAPLTVVGFEGLYGLALMCAILPIVHWLPGKDGAGIHEDSLDTLALLASSPHIRSAAIWFTLGLTVYNMAGMMVTDSLGAVTRTVLETLKTLLVWVLNLLAFFASNRRLGEPWTPHSWLQAVGFGVLVVGTLVYAQGEEVQARRLRAKLRWAQLRDSLAALVPARQARRPLLPPRIAGPAMIRTAFAEPAAVVQAVERLEALLAERRAEAADVEAAGAVGAGPGSTAAAAARERPPCLPTGRSAATKVPGRRKGGGAAPATQTAALNWSQGASPASIRYAFLPPPSPMEP